MPNDRQTRAATGDDVSLEKRVRRIRQENRALFKRLVEGEKRFRGLAKAVWMVQEDERRRLARELHDGIGQTLTALKNQLALTQRDIGDPALDECMALATSALDDTRELSRLLRPAVLDDLGLEAALNWLSRTFGKRAALRLDVSCELGGSRLPTDIETLVFRVAQEALTNVIKHARVDIATIEVSLDSGAVRVCITDDGEGFDTAMLHSSATGERSLGLRGMRDRVELFNGTMQVESKPGQGCRLAIAIPLGDN